ncbi:cupin domain-containing protein [Haladaptatus sp. DFWS20]|uniref:cupin domain-containing protein n=1 Tax=Haladaptatus sp. DFWS20 TaxID=3403467 RepID=UPI003EBB26B0
MYSKINLDEAPDRTRTDEEPAVRMLGYELRERGESRPEEMRFNYFYYDAGNTVRRHTQKEQEELFFVVKGRATMEVGEEEFEINSGDFVVVDPGPWRQIHAHEDTEIFAVGAPNVRDDAVFEADVEETTRE